jgi:hypothetical protein
MIDYYGQERLRKHSGVVRYYRPVLRTCALGTLVKTECLR